MSFHLKLLQASAWCLFTFSDSVERILSAFIISKSLCTLTPKLDELEEDGTKDFLREIDLHSLVITSLALVD